MLSNQNSFFNENSDKFGMPKWIKKWMPFRMDFGTIFVGFYKGKWKQVGNKIYQKSMSTAKSDFLKNRALAAAGARFFRFWGSKLEPKTNQKTIKK